MTKRDAAILGVKVLAIYVVATSILALIKLPFVLPQFLHYYKRIHSSISPSAVFTLLLVPVACRFILSLFVWRLSTRISSLIFPDTLSEDDLGTVNPRGLFVATAITLGTWLASTSLPILLSEALLLGVSGFDLSPNTVAETTRIAGEGVAGVIVGLCLMFFAVRISRRTSLARNAVSPTNINLSILGIRIVAVYDGFSALNAIWSTITPAWIRTASDSGEGIRSYFDFTSVTLGIETCVAAMIPALLLWYLAPRIAKRLHRDTETENPEAPLPTQPA